MSVEPGAHLAADTFRSDVAELRCGAERLVACRGLTGLGGVADLLTVYLFDVRRHLDTPHFSRVSGLTGAFGEIASASAARLAARIDETDHCIAEWLAVHDFPHEQVPSMSCEPMYRFVCHIAAALTHADARPAADAQRERVRMEAMSTRPLALIRTEIAHVMSYLSALALANPYRDGAGTT